MHQQNKSSESKVKFRQASYHWERILEATKFAYANKTKESITFQKFGSQDFWQISNSVLNKGKSAILPLFNCPDMLSSASDKSKLFVKNLSKNSNLDDVGISLPVFPSNFDSSTTSRPDCILVVVLKNCEPELSYKLAELFNKSLEES